MFDDVQYTRSVETYDPEQLDLFHLWEQDTPEEEQFWFDYVNQQESNEIPNFLSITYA